MNFSERCRQATLLLQRLQTVVLQLDKDAEDLEVTHEDEPLLTRMVTSLLECKRLSGDLLYQVVPELDGEEFAVGSAIRIAHDELMRRARGAHTDMEVYTKLRMNRPQRAPLLHAV